MCRVAKAERPRDIYDPVVNSSSSLLSRTKQEVVSSQTHIFCALPKLMPDHVLFDASVGLRLYCPSVPQRE